MRWLILGTVLAVAIPATAAASVGALTQKPGTAGCLSPDNAAARLTCTTTPVGLEGVTSIAVSPDGTSAYITASFPAGGALGTYDRAPDGTLTQKSTAGPYPCPGIIYDSHPDCGALAGEALGGAKDVAVSPDGKSVYVASPLDNAVGIFDRVNDGSAANGRLTADGRVLVNGAESVIVSPDGTSVYALSSGMITIFDRDANGNLTQKAGTAGCITENGNGPNGAGTCTDGTALGPTNEAAISSDGESLYVVSEHPTSAIAIFDRVKNPGNPDNGTLTQEPNAAACISNTGSNGCVDGRGLGGAMSVTVSPDDASVYVAAGRGGLNASQAVAVFDRAAGGGLTQKNGAAGCVSDTAVDGCNPVGALSGASSVRVSPDGRSVYVSSLFSYALSVFNRAPDGALTRKVGSAGCIQETGAGGCANGRALIGPSRVTMSSDGRSVYVVGQWFENVSPISASVAIFDRSLVPSVSISDVSKVEGDAGQTNATLTITADDVSAQDVTVQVQTADGSATQPGDYTATSGTATIPAGQTQTTVDVPINGDIVEEPDENFAVNLSNPANATLADAGGTVTITNDDGPPTVSVNDVSVSEGGTNATFTVTANKPAVGDIVIFPSTVDGTAVRFNDYTPLVGQGKTLPAGQTQMTFDVPLLDDASDEEDETFTVDLVGAINADIGDGVGAATIIDNDGPPALSIADVTVAEGNAGEANATLTVTPSVASGKAITFDFATADGTATQPADYTPSAGPKTITAGQAQTTVTVPVAGDAIDEADETFTVTLANPGNATIGDGSATVTITDDDLPGVGGGGGGTGGGGGADTTDPDTVLDKKPKKKSKKKKVKVEFSSTEASSTFTCQLNKKAAVPCGSPFEAKSKKGKNTLLVSATDAAGNRDDTPAVVKWKYVPAG